MPGTLESVSLASASAVAVLTSDDLANPPGRARSEGGALGAHARGAADVRPAAGPLPSSIISGSATFHLPQPWPPWFVGAALGLDVLNRFYVGDEPLLVGRLKVIRGGGLDGLAIRDLGARIRILAISRTLDHGYLEHPPRRGTRPRAGTRPT